MPGLVDGYFGPADLKAQVEQEPLRSPARLADDAAALRVPPPGGDRRAGPAPLARRPALRPGGAGAGRWPATGCPISSTSRPASTSRRRGRPRPSFDAAAAALEALLPGDGPLPARIAAWDERFTIPVDRVQGVVDALLPGLRRRAADALRPAGRRGPRRLARPRPAVERLQLVRRRAPQPGGAQHGPADPRRGPPVRAPPRDVPRPPPRARLARGAPGRRPGADGGERPLHQRAGVPPVGGPGRPRQAVRRPAGPGGRHPGGGLPAGRRSPTWATPPRRGRPPSARSRSAGPSPPCAAWPGTPP